jgi:hypothetical protein
MTFTEKYAENKTNPTDCTDKTSCHLALKQMVHILTIYIQGVLLLYAICYRRFLDI